MTATSGRDPVATLYLAVRDTLTALPAGALGLVACSGGPDSLALAGVAARLPARTGLRAGAVLIDHGWSAPASAATVRAAAQCRDLGLDPVEVIAVEAAGPGGPEAAARTARYAALDAAADRHSASAVLLGHTLDDQAETVLLGVGRGSGARSLAGMPARRGRYIRPFLALRRELTLAGCRQLGLEPWLDPANQDPAFSRVRVRALAAALEAALGPGAAEALARTAELLAEDADALDEQAVALLRAAGAGSRPGPVPTLDVEVLAGAPAAVRRRALLAAARAAGSPAGDLSRRHALALDGLLVAGRRSGPVHLPGRVIAARDCGRLRFASQDPSPVRTS